MTGASSAIVTFQRSPRNGGATGPKTSAREKFIATANVCTRPIKQRGDEGAGQRTQAADDDDDEQDRPEQRRHGGLRHQRRTGDDAREARERRAGAEHQHEDLRHVMAEHRHHVRMGQRGLNDQADARAGQHGEQRHEHRRSRSAA